MAIEIETLDVEREAFNFSIDDIEAEMDKPDSGSSNVTSEMIDKMVKAAGLKSPNDVKELRQKLVRTLIPKGLEALDFLELRHPDQEYPSRGEEIIEGVVRAGEVMFITSVSKAGKSWFVAQLIWCVIAGFHWLGMKVKKGKVLLIDNELKPCELDWRHTQTARTLEVEPARDSLKVVSKRGQACDVFDLVAALIGKDWTGYSMIVIDAVYKIIPDGKSENDNEAMGKLMNELQRLADETGLAVVCVHHGTKGDQSQKRSLDMLAGAGSFGRSLDASITIRDHEQDGLNVLEFDSRTNVSREAISAKFVWPLWVPVAVAPALRTAGRRTTNAPDERIFELVQEYAKAGQWVSASTIRNRLAMNREKASAALYRLQDEGKIISEQRPNRIKNGDPVDYFSVAPPKNEGTE